MINYLLCALGMWMLMGILFYGCEEVRKTWVNRLCKHLICLPWLAICYIIIIPIVFVYACFWQFFRNAIRGVSVECWEKNKPPKHLKFGCFYLCHDTTARKWCNKFFLVRIVKPSEEIKHKYEKK